ncbi:MAG: hypothetical protein EBZ69_01705 [Alphaproteobacteria bacterium]|nr:hypothetical protein [Alphaproteobacteria bacterium]
MKSVMRLTCQHCQKPTLSEHFFEGKHGPYLEQKCYDCQNWSYFCFEYKKPGDQLQAEFSKTFKKVEVFFE